MKTMRLCSWTEWKDKLGPVFIIRFVLSVEIESNWAQTLDEAYTPTWRLYLFTGRIALDLSSM
jgi:hypothetical protein